MDGQRNVALVDTEPRNGEEVVSRWGGLMAGCFVTLAVLILFAEIGAAIGLSAFEPGDRLAAYAWGAGIWGLLSTVLAFFAGGSAASCVTRVGRRESGWLHGVLVWAVVVPVIGFFGSLLAIGAVGAGGVTAAAAVSVDNATPDTTADADTRARAVRARQEATDRDTLREVGEAAGAVGWAMVAGLLLSLGAAALGGRVGARYGPGARTTTVPYTGTHEELRRAAG